MKRKVYLVSISILSFLGIQAQQITNIDLAKYLTEKKVSVYNRTVTVSPDKTKSAIKVEDASDIPDDIKGAGIVWINGQNFATGSIELDLKGKDVFQRSFIGVAFHGVDSANYEAIYFRPFNFRAKDSVRHIHAVQYISHPQFTWKRLRDERNAQFEKAIENPPLADEWFHARIVVSDKDVKVYVNNAAKPALSVSRLTFKQDGRLGIWLGNSSGGEFANLKITKN